MSTQTIFTPRTAQDWNTLWKNRQGMAERDHDATYWNERAKTFTNKDTPNSYTHQFLELAHIGEDDTVMDMGCGNGNLTLPLAETGHCVLAADFSCVMLQQLNESLIQKNLKDVETLELSWDDDWQSKGISPESYDICIASRSIATMNLREALLKLTFTAKKRCCITLATGSSPRIDDQMLREIGIPLSPSFDDIYALAILRAEGFKPELTYINTSRQDVFTSYDAALEKYSSMASDALAMAKSTLDNAEIEKRIKKWLQEHLQKQTKNDKTTFALSRPRSVPWAFISWDK